MDPALQEQLLPGQDPEEIIEALIRLQEPYRFPNKIRVVSQFGDVITVRVRRGDILEVYQSPAVRSFKAKRVLSSFDLDDQTKADKTVGVAESPIAQKTRGATGKGVVVAILDWGADFAHEDFIRADGSSRFLSIWVQGAKGKRPNKYGYGHVFTQDDLTQALKTDNPYETLAYKPSDGSHGTLVAGIAAGNGRSGHPGLATEADLIFVHLAANERIQNPRLNLGDSVGLLEALDFAREQAGDRPLVVNMSLGAHGGAHDGNSLVEVAVDNFLASRPNTMVCQSVGNYYNSNIHHQNQLRPGREASFSFKINEKGKTHNELEIWYSNQDLFGFKLFHPHTGTTLFCPPGENAKLIFKGDNVGRVYHRLNDPNSAKHHINLFLDDTAPKGIWRVTLYGKKVTDGRFHAWIERNGSKNLQATFEKQYANSTSTNGTICNGYYSLVVGSVGQGFEPSIFSSSGPTADGRSKPDLLAPGEKVPGPRAAPAQTRQIHKSIKRDSGTSFSTPKVTGSIALMLEHATTPVDAIILRTLLLGATKPLSDISDADLRRSGNGLLDSKAAVEAMKKHQKQLNTQKNIMQHQYFDSYLDQEQFAIGSSAGDVHLIPSIPDSRRLPYKSGPPRQFNTLDDALRHALTGGNRESCVIKGRLFSGGQFTLHELNLPICPITPAVIRFQPSSPDICCLVFEGYAPYFPSNIAQPADRWDLFPDLRLFYAQLAATQAAQRGLWLGKLVNSNNNTVNQHVTINGAQPTAALINALSIPEIRLLLIQFVEHLFPVRSINQTTNGHRWIGAAINGVTMVNLPVPFAEPDCYLKVISSREGKVEAINAYDGGAGISLGTVQFNVQNEALAKFLWKVWTDDPDLFNIAFSPLGWTMAAQANGSPELIVTPPGGGAPSFRIQSTQNTQFINYLHSGDVSNNRRDVQFRTRLTERFRLLVVRPHIQEMINKIALDIYARPGLALIERNGIPAINTSNPSQQLFQLKSALLSAYVRATGCASLLIQALRRYGTVDQKLANLHTAVAGLRNIGTFNCATALGARLRAQVTEALRIFREIQQILSAAAVPVTGAGAAGGSTVTGGSGAAGGNSGTPAQPVQSDADLWEEQVFGETADSSLWSVWNHKESEGSDVDSCDCVSREEDTAW